MAQEGYINQSEAADLKGQPVKVNKEPPSTLQGARFPYFTSYISKILQDRFTYQEVFEGGLKVTTTLDAAYQRAAEKTVADHLAAPGDLQPALAQQRLRRVLEAGGMAIGDLVDAGLSFYPRDARGRAVE